MRQEKERLAQELAFPIDLPVSNAFIDLSIVQDTPYYIKGLTKQMAQCYECGLYDATLVLMRKLIETLIFDQGYQRIFSFPKRFNSELSTLFKVEYQPEFG